MHSRARAKTRASSHEPDSAGGHVRLRAQPRFHGELPAVHSSAPTGKRAAVETADGPRASPSQTLLARCRRPRRALAAVEVVIAVAVLGWATNPRLGALPADADLVRGGWWVAYCVVAGVAAPRWRALVGRLRREPAIVGLVVIAWLSIGWTALPAFTAGGRWHLAGSTLVAVWLAARFSPLAITALVGSAVALTSVVSLGLVAGEVPWASTVEGYDAGWTGVWPHRNQAGIRAALGAVALGGVIAAMLPLSRGPGPPRWARWATPRTAVLAGAVAGVGACLAMALGSRSATVPVVLAVVSVVAAAIGLRGLARRGGRARRLAVAGAGLGVAGGMVALAERSMLLDLLDRRPDVTGRTDLWAALWERVVEWPVVGHGYNAFWAGTRGPSAGIWEAFNGPPHAHNGYLDVMLELGVVGLVVMLVIVGRVVIRLGVAAWRCPTPATAAPALLLAGLLLHPWSSSPLFAGRNLFWIALAALALSGDSTDEPSLRS